MDRVYSTPVNREIKYFVGTEVENTIAHGMKTLFVVGLQTVDEIYSHACNEDVNHIFFGANHSFDPQSNEEWRDWERKIEHFLNNNYFCSLDIPMSAVELFNNGSLCEHNNFIPQIRVPIPYIRLWNYNTSIKIDDIGFDKTNPGVWCHSLHKLMEPGVFTHWSEYFQDTVL